MNDYEIPIYYRKPTLVEESQIAALAPRPPVAPCIIITPAEFWPAFKPYADWVTNQGIRTILVSPSTIYEIFPGDDNAERIRNYIKWCYQYGGTWFILGGDDYFVPIRYTWNVFGFSWACDTIEPCDLYFSDLTGDWNSNGNNRWGEMNDHPDRFPEVFVGRITAYNAQEVSNWVAKALHYEKTPGVIFNNALWVYNRAVGIGDAWKTFPLYFVHTHAPDRYANVVLHHLNQGYAFVNINCHGNRPKFCCWIDDLRILLANIQSLVGWLRSARAFTYSDWCC